MTGLDELRRQLDYADGHLRPIDPSAVVRAGRAARGRRRSQTAGGAAVLAAAVAAVVAFVPGTTSPLSVLGMSPAPEPTASLDPEWRPGSGYLTSEQAERPGLDGRSSCATRDPVWESSITATAPPRLLAGYLTDDAGLRQWHTEFTGFQPGVAQPDRASRIHAICWYAGAFTTSSPAEADGQLEAGYLRIDFPLGSDEHLVSSQLGPFPIAIIAPPLPDPALLPPDLRDAQTYVAEQPPGVQLLDGDTPATPRPEPSPAADAITGDCVPYGCPLAEEVPVRVDAEVDGKAIASTDVVEVAVGDTVDVTVTVTAPERAQLTEVTLGLAGAGSTIDQVLLREPAQQAGARTYNVRWRVDGSAGQPRSLRIEYTATSPLHGDRSMMINRTVVQFSVS